MTDDLYFNGIKGASGHYGLSPTSPVTLAQHILDGLYDESRRLRDLEAELQRRLDNDDKIIRLVELLVGSTLDALKGALESEDEWRVLFAPRLAELLFGKQEIRPGDVADLEHLLKRDAQATLGAVVKGLSKDYGKALAELLLAKPPDTSVTLEENLKHQFERQVFEIKDRWLAQERAHSLRLAPEQRKRWREGILQALRRLPIESLRPISGEINIVTQPLRTLIASLASSGQVICHGRQVAVWIGALQHVANQDQATWSDLMQVMDAALRAIDAVGAQVTWEPLFAALNDWLNAMLRVLTHEGAVEWVDPYVLEEAGWGIIFPADMEPSRQETIKARLAPLLLWRQQQAGAHYRVYEGAAGYRPGETANAFLHRHGARAADPANPDYVPYYLLLIGDPEEIPFEFQAQLDVQYAVGRLDFGDDLDAYGHYAHNVVTCEKSSYEQDPNVVFFSVSHGGDPATTLSAKHLVDPLHEQLQRKTQNTAWRVERVAVPQATKAALLNTMKRRSPPALLFTASHGLEFGPQDPRQREAQGALLCQDWRPGPGSVPTNAYVAARDIGESVNLQGAITFLYACYSAGTPRYDEYTRQAFKETGAPIAAAPFTAALPRAMLALRDRGALAVIGHIERAWGTAFLSSLEHRPLPQQTRRNEHIDVFASAIERLLNGYPVGAALEYFNGRYAALSTELAALYETIGDPPSIGDAYQLAELWTATCDARGYVVLGDPAVRLRAGLNYRIDQDGPMVPGPALQKRM